MIAAPDVSASVTSLLVDAAGAGMDDAGLDLVVADLSRRR